MVQARVWWGKVKKRDLWEDGRIILKWMLVGRGCHGLDESDRGGLL
jgi:hypothetical protein